MTSPGGQAFVVLGIEPTLDAAAVKRAYFAALQKHPPHLDPDGFRQIRQAYETLSRGAERLAAFMTSPPQIKDALGALDASIGEEIARLVEKDARHAQDAAAKRTAIDSFSRLSLADAVRLFG